VEPQVEKQAQQTSDLPVDGTQSGDHLPHAFIEGERIEPVEIVGERLDRRE
jgi:hypothetical protein